MGYHQLRMVGRYWSRRYPYFSYLIIVPPEVENVYQPRCRSDDHLRGYLRGYVSTGAHGPVVVRILLGVATT